MRHLLLSAAVCLGLASTAGAEFQQEAAQPERRGDKPAAPRTPVILPSPVPGALTGPAFGGAQVNVNAAGTNVVGDAANEPSLAVDPNNRSRIAIGWRQFDSFTSNFRQAGRAYSRDGGRTWHGASVLDPGVFRSDPVLRADADGVVYYYSLTLETVMEEDHYSCQMFLSDDSGKHYVGPIQAFGGDKAWTALDRTGGVGHGNFYAMWDTFGCCMLNTFSRSSDGGMTYLEPVEMPTQPNWGTICVAPDGAVCISGNANYNLAQFTFLKSSNAQNPGETPTWDFSRTVNLGGRQVQNRNGSPNPGGLLGQVWLAADHSTGPTRGYLYMLCSVDPTGGDPLDVMLSRSTDGGQTWDAPREVTGEPAGTNAHQWFGTIGVAPNGRIDVVWFDGRGTGAVNRSVLRYANSIDGGLTFSPSVVLSPVFDSWLGWPNQNKLGDYMDIDSDRTGCFVAYAATFNGEQDVYCIRIGDPDCNNNGVGDGVDIAHSTSADVNRNGIPDECDGLGDLNCDDMLNNFDIDPFVLAISDAAGYAAAYPRCERSQADINGDGSVDNFDVDPFVELLAAR